MKNERKNLLSPMIPILLMSNKNKQFCKPCFHKLFNEPMSSSSGMFYFYCWSFLNSQLQFPRSQSSFAPSLWLSIGWWMCEKSFTAGQSTPIQWPALSQPLPVLSFWLAFFFYHLPSHLPWGHLLFGQFHWSWQRHNWILSQWTYTIF